MAYRGSFLKICIMFLMSSYCAAAWIVSDRPKTSKLPACKKEKSDDLAGLYLPRKSYPLDGLNKCANSESWIVHKQKPCIMENYCPPSKYGLRCSPILPDGCQKNSSWSGVSTDKVLYYSSDDAVFNIEKLIDRRSDFCRIGDFTIKTCTEETVSRERVTWAWDGFVLKILSEVGFNYVEEADDLSAYTCTGGKGDIDCSSGLCNGDARFKENFDHDPASEWFCKYNDIFSRMEIHAEGRRGFAKMVGVSDILVSRESTEKKVTESWCEDCSFSCERAGIRVHSGLMTTDHYVVCGNPSCTAGYTASNDFLMYLPREMSLAGGRFDIELFSSEDSIRKRYSAVCPAADACDSLGSWYSSSRWMVPGCYGPFNIVLTVLVSGLTLYALGKVLWVFEYILCKVWFVVSVPLIPLKTRFRKFRESRDYKKNDDYSRAEMGVSSGIRKQAFYIALLSILGTVSTCSDVVSMSAQSRECETNRGTEKCDISGVQRLVFPLIGQESCLMVDSYEGKRLGAIKISTNNVRVKCLKTSLYWVADYSVSCVHTKRCRGMGKCEDTYCEDFKPKQHYEGWESYEDKIGRSNCVRTPGCAGNGCGLCADGCLFYRWYLDRPNSQTWEVFECGEWAYEADFNVTLIKDNSKVEKRVNTRPGIREVVDDLSITLISITQPPQPKLNKCFLCTDNGAVCGLAECSRHGELAKGKIGEVNCPTQKDAQESTEKCSFATGLVDVSTHTDSVSCYANLVSPLKVAYAERLPYTLQGLTILNKGREVYGLLRQTSSLEVQVSMKSAHFSTQRSFSKCSMKVVDAKGCYNCNRGFKIRYQAWTDQGTAMARLECPEAGIYSVLEVSTTRVEQESGVLKTGVKHVDEVCTLVCPANRAEVKMDFYLEEDMWVDQRNETKVTGAEDEKDSGGFNWNSLLNASWFNTWWKKILVVLGLIGGVVVVFMILRIIFSKCC